MTDKQKNQIAKLRESGMSYTQISKAMDLSINSIKTYCRRHGLGGTAAFSVETTETVACAHCGKPVVQNPGRKVKKFCSDKCRMLWWNSHTDQVNRKANYECTCAKCKKVFILRRNTNRSATSTKLELSRKGTRTLMSKPSMLTHRSRRKLNERQRNTHPC